ncbi:hypothetical protein [Weissella confusa]
MNEVANTRKKYLTSDEAKAQIKHFIKSKGRIDADKNEVAAFLIECGFVGDLLTASTDLLTYLNKMTATD